MDDSGIAYKERSLAAHQHSKIEDALPTGLCRV